MNQGLRKTVKKKKTEMKGEGGWANAQESAKKKKKLTWLSRLKIRGTTVKTIIRNITLMPNSKKKRKNQKETKATCARFSAALVCGVWLHQPCDGARPPNHPTLSRLFPHSHHLLSLSLALSVFSPSLTLTRWWKTWRQNRGHGSAG